MSRTIGLTLLVAIAAAAGTWLLGWWTLPLVGAVVGVWRGTRGQARGTARVVALGAALGWGALLALAAAGPRFAPVAARLEGIFGLPAAAIVALTLLLAALLAGSAAMLGTLVRGTARRDVARAEGRSESPRAA